MEAMNATVKDYILTEFLPGERPDALDESTPLITGGILDSIATVRLVVFLEEQFGVRFQPHEMSPDHLDSIRAITDTVRAKRAEHA
ncbi:MAG TPA: acyl carrier protein [Longimicrobiales bacterium]|nr:acyl carrier protein [Longimicrobiales bacterium]